MIIKHYIKYAILMLALALLVPLGINRLAKGISIHKLQKECVFESTIERIDNPNKFDREYILSSDGNTYLFRDLQQHESKIREFHDTFGIQLYFVTYPMSYNEVRESKESTIEDVINWLKENNKYNEYGLYCIKALYKLDTEMCKPGFSYYKTELDCYTLFGNEVDSWWNTKIQQIFEKSADKNDLYIGYYNPTKKIVTTYHDMIKISSANYIEHASLTWYAFMFCVFTVVPIGFALVIIITDISKRIKLKKQEKLMIDLAKEAITKQILDTPLKTLEEEHAERLRQKYKEQ